MTIANSILNGNSALSGGGIYNYAVDSGSAPMTIIATTLSGNWANNGGGISSIGNFGSATLTVVASTLTGNSADFGGGILNAFSMLTASNCTLTANSASNDGGGIYNVNANATVSNSSISSNSASVFGGGIFTEATYGSATVSLSASTLNGNSASATGGGIFSEASGGSTATVTVRTSTLSGNSAPHFGGGIWNVGVSASARLEINASTFGDNSSSLGGGIGSIANYSGNATVTVSASTFSGNSAPSGGIYNARDDTSSATLEIGDTVLSAGSSGANIVNASGTVTSFGYNLASDDASGFLTATGDQINTDPMLGPLQDNGGPTLTHALLPGSPAIDAGQSGGLTTDQRGLPRPYDNPTVANAAGGDGSDIGAFEVQPTGPALAAQIQQPINADGSSTFKANRGVVPVKFTLTSDGTPTCALPPATIAVTRVGGTAPGPIDEASYIMAADSGSNFRISDCQYVYNLAARSLGAGTYRVEILIEGVVVGSATFELK